MKIKIVLIYINKNLEMEKKRGLKAVPEHKLKTRQPKVLR